MIVSRLQVCVKAIGLLIGDTHQIQLEFGVLVFEDGGKLKNPEKNPRSRKDENQQQTWTNSTHI